MPEPAPATTPPNQTPAAPPAAAAPAAPAAPAAAPASWYGDIANPDVKAFVQAKNYADPATAMEAFYNTSKMIGVPAEQLIRKPKDANDTAGIAAYRAALGVPADPKAYEIPVPEGQATTLRDWAAPVFHELGLTADQAKGLGGKWNEFLAGQVKAAEESDKLALAAAETGLRTEWGQQYEANTELARRAFTQFAKAAGMSDAAAQLDSVMGVAGSIKLWNAIGKAMGEGTFKSGDPVPAAMTPADAQVRIQALRNDRDWVAAYNSGDMNKQLEMQQLIAIQSGDDSGLRTVQQRMGIRA